MSAEQAFPLPHLPATFGRACTVHPLSEQVALLIKTFLPQGFSAEWEWLALYGCCDVFLPMHRSEGFGRGMAEALQLGGTGSGACGGAGWVSGAVFVCVGGRADALADGPEPSGVVSGAQ